MTELRSKSINYSPLTRRGRRAEALAGELLTPGMKVGLFGGTFDPPHAGHSHLAKTAMKRLGLDRVWWLVSPQNPLKTQASDSMERRLAAVAQQAYSPGMVVTDLESRLGSCRTIDIVLALKKRHPLVHFVWLMGADNLASFHRWANWKNVFENIPIAVMARPQDPVRARLSPAAKWAAKSRICEHMAHILPLKKAPAWTYLTEPLHSASSTDIRAQR